MSKNVLVIGGGIIGLSTAYYLQKEGHQVTVIDKGNFSEGASYVNAGYITPSHIISLAAPGMITKGIKWMFNSQSPFYIKPRFDIDFFKWSWAFKKSATKTKVEKAIKPILDINILSRDLYEEMQSSSDFNFYYQHKGLLMLYQKDKTGEEEWKVGERAIKEGLKVENLTKEQVQRIEPNVDLNIKGAVYYHSDAHMTPHDFMQQLKNYLQNNGVIIMANEEVVDFEQKENKITTVKTTITDFIVDEVVVATGSWTQKLMKKLQIDVPVQAGKGYRINVGRETGITIPAILMEAKVAVTPMNKLTRFAGTMEIGGIDHTINPVRVNAIAKAGENYYSGLKITEQEKQKASCGLRPCSPDGLPYIGRVHKLKNVVVASGHAMMGWSLGPATGKLVSEIISEQKPSLNLEAYNPNRKF